MTKRNLCFVIIIATTLMFSFSAYCINDDETKKTLDYSINASQCIDHFLHMSQDTSSLWKTLPLFKSGKAWRRWLVRNDGNVLIQLYQDSDSNQAIVVRYRIMVKRSLPDAAQVMDTVGHQLAEAMLAVSSPSSPLPRFPVFWVFIPCYGREYIVEDCQYRPNSEKIIGFHLDSEMKQGSYFSVLPENIQNNRMTLSDFLQIFLPQITMADIDNYLVFDAHHPEETHQDCYRIPYQNDAFLIYVWHTGTEIDESLVCSFSLDAGSLSDTELLQHYLAIYSHLPGVDPELLPVLFLLNGEEFSWTQSMQSPLVQMGNWKVSIVDRSLSAPVSVQPTAVYIYIQ